MNNPLSNEQIKALAKIDTPTVCNAIEKFDVRGRMEGFLGMDIRCLTPSVKTMVGYAVTVTVDSTTPEVAEPSGVRQAWLQAMDASPKPAVLVLKDVGPNPRKSAHIGDVLGTIASRMGVVGIVTDGGLRDFVDLERIGLACFALGLAPSHGNPRFLAVNVGIEIDGVKINPGDLLHGDVNGVTTVPLEIAAEIPAVAAQILKDESETLSYVLGSDFSLEGLIQRVITH